MSTLNNHTVARMVTYSIYDEQQDKEKEISAQLTEGNGGILTLFMPDDDYMDIPVADIPYVIKVLKEFC